MSRSIGLAARWLLALILSAALVIAAQVLVSPLPTSLGQLTMPDLRNKAWPSCAVGAPTGDTIESRRILILHDHDPAGRNVEISQATLMGNIASHFGKTTIAQVRDYQAGDFLDFDALIYLGTRYSQSLPKAFRRDVNSGKRRVLWLKENIDKLSSRATFFRRYGWLWKDFDGPRDFTVNYKGTALSPSGAAVPLTTISRLDDDRVRILASASVIGKARMPWALKSKHLTYVADVPLGTTSTHDASLALADLLHDVVPKPSSLRLQAQRALVRIEDVGPMSNPDELRSVAQALRAEGVPFSFTVYPLYVGPIVDGKQRTVSLADRPLVVRAIVEMLEGGATMVSHGYTHQYENRKNPRSGESGTDYEFFLAHLDEQGEVVYDGPVPGDSEAWAQARMDKALTALTDLGLPKPTMFTVPHYAASPNVYTAIAERFQARYDRGQYFSPAWDGTPPAAPYLYEQATPFLTRDAYGSVVVPENLGYLATTSPTAKGLNTRSDVVAGAEALLTVRESVASFFYHPFLGSAELVSLVREIRGMGYTFVSPCEL
jgi:uncharacterized protein YdaL